MPVPGPENDDGRPGLTGQSTSGDPIATDVLRWTITGERENVLLQASAIVGQRGQQVER
jgi:hypothetical protein